MTVLPVVSLNYPENGHFCNIFMVRYILNITIQVTHLSTVSSYVYNAEV